MEPFIIKQYDASERPIIKGNGFDGLEIGEDRDEAERFVAYINTEHKLMAQAIRNTLAWMDSVGFGDILEAQQLRKIIDFRDGEVKT